MTYGHFGPGLFFKEGFALYTSKQGPYVDLDHTALEYLALSRGFQHITFRF
jgi:hypothetical protein